MSTQESEATKNTLRLALINVRSRLNVDEYVKWAVEGKYDLLILTESPGRAHLGKANCAACESEEARVAIYKVNNELTWSTRYVTKYHVVVRVDQPRVVVHGWYLPHAKNNLTLRDEIFDSACTEFAVKRTNTIHLGDMNADRAKGKGAQLQAAALNGRLVNLNNDNTPTFTHDGNGTRTAIDWVLASEDIADRVSMAIRPEPHGSDHDLIEVDYGVDSIARSTQSAVEKIKPAVFLKEVKRLIDERGVDKWNECKEEALATAKKKYKAKGHKQSAELERLNREVEKLSKLIGRAKGAMNHMKPELKRLMNQRDKQQSKEKEEDLKEKLSGATNANIWTKVKLPKKSRKATFVKMQDEQLRGKDAGQAILQKAYPLAQRERLKVPVGAPPDTTAITIAEIEQAVEKVSNRAAPGRDGISWDLMKKWHKRMPDLLHTLFNKWYRDSLFPKELKESMVIPLIKDPTSSSELKNIRPVSLLATMGKWYERVLDTRMMYHLEKLQLISPDQYAYRELRGAKDALEVLVEAHKRSLRMKNCEVMLQVDVKGAFDNLDHQAIVDEASKHGLPSNMVRTLVSYLEDRKAIMCVDGEVAERSVLQGAAQGSALGPHLYLLATNRAIRVATAKAKKEPDVTVHTVSFADDVIATVSSTMENRAIEVVKSFANDLAEQLKKVGLEVAPEKTNVMFISKKPIVKDFEVLNNVVKTKAQLKILGIVYKHNLTWDAHLDKVAEKVRRKSQILRATMGNHLQMEQRRTIAQAALTPSVTYCASAWYDPKATTAKVETRLKAIGKDIACVVTNGPFKASGAAHHLMADMRPVKYDCMIAANVKRDLNAGKWLETGLPLVKKASIGELPHPSEWVMRDIEACIMDDEDASRIQAEWAYYTDGSRYQLETGEQVTGAAYVRQSGEEESTEMFKLNGSNTAYQAETLAIKAALANALSLTHPTSVAIVSDSQSALVAIGQPRSTDREIIDAQRAITRLEAKGTTVSLYWVKAHVGVLMNEKADEAAKRAAVEGKNTLVPIPLSAVKRKHAIAANEEYERDYVKDKYGREIKKYAARPSERPKDMVVTWRTAQIYSGHGLNRESMRFGFKGSLQKCPCGKDQVMSHVIVDCPIFVERNVVYAREAKMSMDEFFAPWDQLCKNRKFHHYIYIRAPSLAAELRQCNQQIIDEDDLRRALASALRNAENSTQGE